MERKNNNENEIKRNFSKMPQIAKKFKKFKYLWFIPQLRVKKRMKQNKEVKKSKHNRDKAALIHNATQLA